jgi:hypothetical protein
MLRQIADLPQLEAMVRTPTLLSYYIASNMPLQDATRQELLEVDGTVRRLRREIELLENMDQLRCKCCSVCTLYTSIFANFDCFKVGKSCIEVESFLLLCNVVLSFIGYNCKAE